MLQRKQIMRRKEHWSPKCVVRRPFSLFTCLATTQQRLVTSPRHPGVVRLHVNTGHFSTTARRVTWPTWGPPPSCKQAQRAESEKDTRDKTGYHVTRWIWAISYFTIISSNLSLTSFTRTERIDFVKRKGKTSSKYKFFWHLSPGECGAMAGIYLIPVPQIFDTVAGLKDVRANCFCASLLRTQIHMPRHALSACAKCWNEQW